MLAAVSRRLLTTTTSCTTVAAAVIRPSSMVGVAVCATPPRVVASPLWTVGNGNGNGMMSVRHRSVRTREKDEIDEGASYDEHDEWCMTLTKLVPSATPERQASWVKKYSALRTMDANIVGERINGLSSVFPNVNIDRLVDREPSILRMVCAICYVGPLLTKVTVLGM
jgi:hypothetical protein